MNMPFIILQGEETREKVFYTKTDYALFETFAKEL
jgi:hypothetical protein